MAVQAKLKVTDIKQYMYCPRIIYFTYCQPVHKKVTFKMEYGQMQHSRLEKLEQRRKLKRYGFENGEKLFKLRLSSDKHNLSGVLDLVIISESKIIPVEYKNSTNRPGLNHKFQLAAYALLLQEKFQKPIDQGLIYLIPNDEVFSYEITKLLLNEVEEVICKIHKIIETEAFPMDISNRGKCTDCEYYNYCGDV